MKLDCREFENNLGRILGGSGSGKAEEQCRIHLSGCPSCRLLWDLFLLDPAAPAVNPPIGLTRRILDRTSGSACQKARELLCDFVDRSLGDDAASLVIGHLENCPSCQQVESVLKGLSVALPAMAFMEPGSHFTQSVLEATSRRKPFDHRGKGGWRGLLQRPRFAWEAAYFGAALVLLLVRFFPLLPGSPSLVRLASLEAMPAVFWQATGSAASGKWSQGRELASELRRKLAGALESNQQQWSNVLQGIERKTSHRWQKTKSALRQKGEQEFLPVAGKARKLWQSAREGSHPRSQPAPGKK